MSKLSKELSEIILFSHQLIGNLSLKNTPCNLYEPINYILSLKSKNIRSILAMISYTMMTKSPSEDIKNLLISIEIFHNFTLVHDDLMDNAFVRRGKETINHKWSSNQSVLSGDVLLIESYNFLLKLQSPNSLSIIKLFNETAIKICQGQQLDLDMQEEKIISLDDYFNMIDLKTSELIVFSLLAPFKLFPYQDLNLDIIKKIGYNLGRLFQIQDDYLDLYGDMKKTGKLVGGDIMEQKKTFLYTLAITMCSSNTKEKLINSYHLSFSNTNQEYSDFLQSKVSQVSSIYDSLDIKQLVEDKIDTLGSAIIELISQLDVPNHSKNILREFSMFILHRDL